MKKLLLTVAVTFMMCSCDKPQKTFRRSVQIVEYEEVYCSKCNGTGVRDADAGDRIALGLVTFGLGALVDTKECSICKGTGVISRRKLNN